MAGVTPRAMGAGEWLMLAELPPLTVVLGRVGLAAILLVAALLIDRQRLAMLRDLAGPFLLMGTLSNALPFALVRAAVRFQRDVTDADERRTRGGR